MCRFAIRAGEFFGVVGPNGAGKTTLLRAILGTLKPQAGHGRVARTRTESPIRWGYVPQRDAIDSVIPFTARDVVMMGRYRSDRSAAFSAQGGCGRRRCGALEHVGVEDLAGRVVPGPLRRTETARADRPGAGLRSRRAGPGRTDERHGPGLARGHAGPDRYAARAGSSDRDHGESSVWTMWRTSPSRSRLSSATSSRSVAVDDVLTAENLSALYRIPMHVDQIGGRVPW